jgi:hypothetical protein
MTQTILAKLPLAGLAECTMACLRLLHVDFRRSVTSAIILFHAALLMSQKWKKFHHPVKISSDTNFARL